jgi:RNA polymerase sigma-70 factor, ECF subfamily
MGKPLTRKLPDVSSFREEMTAGSASICPQIEKTGRNLPVIQTKTAFGGDLLEMTPPDWSELYERHAAALLLYARQWLPRPSDAEDAVHDAFVRLIRSPRQFDEKPVPVLYQAVKWACLDRIRKESRRDQREEQVQAQEAEPVESLFETHLEQRERREALEAAVKRLPDEQREVITLKIWSELGFREIAEVLGISINTAGSRYRYALKKLGQMLEGEEQAALS